MMAVSAETQASKGVESQATAGALTIIEGLNHLKKNGPGKTSGVLLTAGTRSLQNAWIKDYSENKDGPYLLRTKMDLARSTEGKAILRDFTRQYKQDGNSVLGSLLSTGGTIGDISIIVKSLDPNSIKESVKEARKLSPPEQAEELETSRAYPVLQAAGLDTSIVVSNNAATAINTIATFSGSSFSPDTAEKSKSPQNQAEKKPALDLNVAGYQLKNDPSARAPSSSGRTATATAAANNHEPSTTSSSEKPAKGKVGINFGVYSTQAIIDALGDLGSWYYNYSPHPNRADRNSTYDTVSWANKYNKEFVPMIISKRFKLGPGDESCALTTYLAPKDEHGNAEQPCSSEKIGHSLLKMKGLFGPSNQPKYLMVFNEPFHPGDAKASNGKKYTITPWQAAHAWAKLQGPAKEAGLKMVSPTAGASDTPLEWISMFLKRCDDLKNDPSAPCDVEKIYAFSVHEYECSENFWKKNYLEQGFQNKLVARMRYKKGGFYGGRDWEKFIKSRKVWVTETNCNWEPDFLEAQTKGKYIRKQEETCRRATGQKPGWGSGSLYTMIHLPSQKLERFAWWNTYADPAQNSDSGAVGLSSQNRITAVRLLDDNYHWTPSGRAYQQAYADESGLSSVDCGGEK
jgi:hypothetical protein